MAPKTIEQIEQCDKSVYHAVSLQISLNSDVVYNTKQRSHPAVKAVPFPLGSRKMSRGSTHGEANNNNNNNNDNNNFIYPRDPYQ